MYKILRTILFAFDPEKVHSFTMNCLVFICKLPFGKKFLTARFQPENDGKSRSFLEIPFANPVGLAAGFDKNAAYLNELEALGFGFVEIGTVTPLPQAGNDKPRVFRLPEDKALVNRMGFNNDGVEVIKKRLQKWHKSKAKKHKLMQLTAGSTRVPYRLIIGGNIGKNKITDNENAWQDYIACFNALHDYVDYFVVNVSSPNTPGLRALQEKESLRKILTQLQFRNASFEKSKPILLKIAPDLTIKQINDVIALAIEINLDGLVISNTTIGREDLSTNSSMVTSIGAGGLSGLPLKQKSTELVQYIHQKTKGGIPIIASGGIFTGADAKEKLAAGAGLVQVWTGFVYQGPSIVKGICNAL
ncbi:MAG: quinone-dependent dihydroorotate dehydrogenase [Ferruginibacter sp.]